MLTVNINSQLLMKFLKTLLSQRTVWLLENFNKFAQKELNMIFPTQVLPTK